MKGIREKMINEIKAHLLNTITPFWKKLRDDVNGGFYGYVDFDLKVHQESPKGVILNSRILWYFSNQYLVLKDEDDLIYARHAYKFLKEKCLDKEYGGVYWMLDAAGKPLENMKHTYNQAFAIYALSSYYAATKDEEALKIAQELFGYIENTCTDEYGYLEAFDRKWQPIDNTKLSDNKYLCEEGVIAEKTMNTLLHVLEAYTELYHVTQDNKVGDRLRNLLHVFEEKVYNKQTDTLEVFFDTKLHTIADMHSYGHDIEASWLLDRAAEVLGEENEAISKLTKAYTTEVAYKIKEVAFKNGALNNERFKDHIDETRIWWVQAEGVVGFINAYEKTGDKVFLETANALWDYIKSNLVDPRPHSEWFWQLDVNGKPDIKGPIAEPWKCPYHNGRMCLEVIKRNITKSVTPVNPNASKEVIRLMAYLAEISGSAVITGQHTQTTTQAELDHIQKVTGKLPALCGFELLGYSPNINFEDADEACLKEVNENIGTLENAMDWVLNKKGILTFTWHWFSPTSGRDKSFYSIHTDFNPEKALSEGTDENIALIADMDYMAEKLKAFRDLNIPILWRPFHEAEGDWFWWGSKGFEVSKKLWRLMYNRYTNYHKLDNLIWVWNSPEVTGYPGDDVVDIITRDLYPEKHCHTSFKEEYDELIKITDSNKIAALGEIGTMPSIEEIVKTSVPWCWFMIWSNEFCLSEEWTSDEELYKAYHHECAITLDKLPSLY